VTPPRSGLVRPVFAAAALLLVFGWLLPRFIDYHEVWAALTELDLSEIAVLILLAVARIPTEALMYRAFLPGLSIMRGSEAYLSSNFASQLLPPPSASVIQYGYFRGGGYPARDAGLAALGSFLFPTVGRFLLPLLALLLLLATGGVTGAVWIAGSLSVVAGLAAGGLSYLFLRRDDRARRLGTKAQRPLSWMLVKAHRAPIADGAQAAARLRSETLTLLRRGWALGSVGVAANLALTYLLLLSALRFVGVSAHELPAAAAFAAFAIAFWAGAVLPITGSGLGVVDAVLIAMLFELGHAPDDALLAAALLWRVFYSAVPLPFGAITLSRYRRLEPTTPERRTTEPAT
jgi:uncharacterized membrane protein YbhN (UPF0104 family)